MAGLDGWMTIHNNAKHEQQQHTFITVCCHPQSNHISHLGLLSDGKNAMTSYDAALQRLQTEWIWPNNELM
jgi:hypothetical protein